MKQPLHQTADTIEVAPIERAALLDAWLIGSRLYWQRRAAVLAWAKPRLTDYRGAASREDLSRRWRELDEAERACRARAELLDVETFDATLRAVS